MSEELNVVYIPVEDIEETPLNLRTMTPDEFNDLCESIRDNGYVEPIQVVKYGSKYRIVNGNHRFVALRDVFKWKKIPCVVVGENWDEVRYWQEVIRLNNIRGSFDPVLLAEKVLELREKTKKMYDVDTLRRKLGFSGKKEFDRILKQVEKALPEGIKEAFRKSKREIESIEDLSRVLNTLFREYGKTLECNFMFFVWGGKECVMVRCDSELWSLVKMFFERLEARKQDAREVFKSFFKRELGLE